MKKNLSIFLALTMLCSLLTVPALAVGQAPSARSDNLAEHWFYDQLTAQGKAIYDALWDMYQSGMMKDGRTSYDLADKGVVSQPVITAYLDGDRTLFNDFAAAKDAFDLEHPEVWYMDSSYLSFRVTQDTAGRYHAYMGPGRADTYYVSGVQSAADVNQKTLELNTAVNSIVNGAKAAGGGSGEEDIVKQIQYAHDQVTGSISYRLETQCQAANAGFLRTAYGLVTHEGVCEAYARSLQLILNRLGIPCVPIHGAQTSGEAEAHMWNAVQIGGEWYVIDATWDDPIDLNAGSGKDGLDGSETRNYLLVGQDVVGGNWKPSGYVSTGTMEFRYPDISPASYGTGIIQNNGLTVTFAEDLMEDIKSTVYRISFNGDGLVEAAKKGFYFLVKEYKINADGSVNQFEDWYYMAHGLHGLSSSFDPNNDFRNTINPYYCDGPLYTTMNASNVEYVEFAVTTKAPPDWNSADDLLPPDMGGLGGYYTGSGSDIVAETGLIYNENGGYDPPPYVKNVSPLFNSPVYVGQTYTIHIEFTDSLYHPNQASIDNAVEGKVNDAAEAMQQDITLYYNGITYSWGVNARQPHTFADKPVPQNVRWTCAAHPGGHSGTANTDGSITMSGIGADCRLTTLEFEFAASRMWADDSVQYEFHLTGLVGVKSNKFVRDGGWSYVFENQSAHCSYRCSQGIDWNLWGQPQLLDNPDGLDLSRMVVEGVDGRQESLEALRDQMHLDDYDMNGRLMLVVENYDSGSARAGELSSTLESETGISENAIKGSSLYEIDFARICQKTIVKTGQSLRLSVGFPEGFDASMAGVVFKAYHFTRDAGGEVNGVEEIPVTVTPYGLVIMCNSFSPFAIVALDAELAGIEPDADKTVMILSGEGGDFLFLSDVPAAGENGVVTLSKGQHITLKVRPRDGYQIDAVTFDGHPIPVSDDGAVVIAYEDIQSSACFLSASFISSAVQQADKKAGMAAVIPDVGNESSSDLSHRLEQSPGTAPKSSAEAVDSTPLSPFSIAYPSTQMVEVDGKKVAFHMYALLNANGYFTNFIRVTDLAFALNGTRVQFNVRWNGAAEMVTGMPSTVTGGENRTPFSGERPYTLPNYTTYLNGEVIKLSGILLTDDNGGGYTYYKVYDLARVLDFKVEWVSGRGVVIETDKPFSEL